MSDALGAIGLGCLAVAGFTLSLTAGLVVAGCALLYVSWRLERR